VPEINAQIVGRDEGFQIAIHREGVDAVVVSFEEVPSRSGNDSPIDVPEPRNPKRGS